MIIKHAKFIKSSNHYSQCPAENMPEYAFVGRSNVGKSSLINMLVNHKNLAKTSGTPGKTTLINHYLVNDNWYLVDLPGYGFAKASKDSRKKWELVFKEYLGNRKNLMTIFILIDANIPPQKIDIEFINWVGNKKIPLSIIYTKCDKSKVNQINKNLDVFEKEMLNHWESMPVSFTSSSTKKIGSEEILNYIEQTNKLFKN
ncbi:MAG: YihA family ribosome biogenesis GTP-binding protein [Bacteroidia bacterium]|nr:ribosome biogenesis GTP-binding protein YihA/YsxC [Bacteroidia bacterium]NNC86692.1 YihA family ribosome biogenesis GTP-binding protein [Bacteroidia bacterium]NNM15722.1 YihA family ribosome biogenesis GTP-binding protein [Bacteroidia bacterium]